jgi:uncharacterized protein YaeQ
VALRATVYRCELALSDVDRGVYGSYALTLARHPSETDERMMVRLLAFALHAHPDLAFGRGLSADDEPDIWRRDLTGAIDTWIDVGQPDEKLVRRACGRADRVFVYTYGGHVAGIWWKQVGENLARNANLCVMQVPLEASRAMAGLAQRTMQLQYTIQEGQIWVTDGQVSVAVELQAVKSPSPSAY